MQLVKCINADQKQHGFTAPALEAACLVLRYGNEDSIQEQKRDTLYSPFTRTFAGDWGLHLSFAYWCTNKNPSSRPKPLKTENPGRMDWRIY
ncbi:hypothetical protein COCON_G00083160 [Conger conger]|uniref:Uncharacterized protein n=1 Tax=Conger conger TaxID=82655 RepID=A0A9Q1DQ18_CONCO|nr:hypothetical protein COCON_G00083160 [Conger conger]